MSYGAFPIFPLHGNPYKTVLKHNKFLNSRESYAILQHTGATQAITGVRESCFVCLKIEFVHYYRFSSVFGLWHKANSAAKSSNFPPIFQKQKF